MGLVTDTVDLDTVRSDEVDNADSTGGLVVVILEVVVVV
jgi:hypothetical protein